ncbi:uncharacterized protein [Euwallacea fornicatus]|uniref:uncharacterized protein n=1 Tax=Euwallacea fornicatus TaxID=995702 RepID=UPI00338D4CD9
MDPDLGDEIGTETLHVQGDTGALLHYHRCQAVFGATETRSRENLLIRPWEVRRYQNHRKKVQAATPAIDTKAPALRPHVAIKLKKLQKESERAQRIENENLILLQRLKHIMGTHWVDNYLPPQPTFLNRVAMFRPTDSGVGLEEEVVPQEGFLQKTPPPGEGKEVERRDERRIRKLKCLACTPTKVCQLDERRVPWEAKRCPVGRRSNSVPPHKPTSSLRRRSSSPARAKIAQPKSLPTSTINLYRGSLKLSVLFPLDTVVDFDKRRIKEHRLCNCPLKNPPEFMTYVENRNY